jgi:hypothetical protein
MRARDALRCSFILIATLCLGGCAGPLGAGYDPVLDERVTLVDAKIEAFLDAMERAGGSADGAFRGNSGFYSDVRGELDALKRRAGTSPRTDMVKVLSELQDNVETLRRAHQSGGERGLDRIIIEQVRGVIRTNFDILYKRQALLRMG